MIEEVEKDGQTIQGMAVQIGESFGFDSVIIIATKRGDRSSNAFHGIAGNYFASYGAITDWLLREDTKTQNSVE